MQLPEIAPTLLAWYDKNAADLPWRGIDDAYRTWLSEIMLQQTQIETVKPYYHRFLEQYPTIEALAAAPLDDILKQWEGLGYYSRARNLHKTARIITNEMDGKFPQTAAELIKLPGIGRYTSGAVASIAFNESVPVLDGNVIRVFTRVFNIADDVTETATKKHMWDIAGRLVPEKRPGDYNQALMEIGQTICTRRNPLCEICPLNTNCLANAIGAQHERPVKKKKPRTPHYDVAAGIIYDDDGRILIAQRPLDGLLGGLWEFPGGKQEKGETLEACLKRELREELAIEVDVNAFFVKVRHAFTHFKITLHAFECHYLGATPPHTEPQLLEAKAIAWVKPEDFEKYSFGKADRMVIQALKDRSNQLL